MEANKTILQMKYARIVSIFAEQTGITLEDALVFLCIFHLSNDALRHRGYALQKRWILGRISKRRMEKAEIKSHRNTFPSQRENKRGCVISL